MISQTRRIYYGKLHILKLRQKGYTLLKEIHLTKEAPENMESLMTFKEIESLIKNLPRKKKKKKQIQMIYQRFLPNVLGTTLPDNRERGNMPRLF